MTPAYAGIRVAVRQQVFTTENGRAVVGGAGLSGVQVAGELAAFSDEGGLDLDVTLVEQAEQAAPGFGRLFAAALDRELTDRGVTVQTGAIVGTARSVRGERVAVDPRGRLTGAATSVEGQIADFPISVWSPLPPASSAALYPSAQRFAATI